MLMDLTNAVHFSARSPKGFRASLKGVACSVAVVIGISLSIAEASSSQASIVQIKSLARKQLSIKQYLCHNLIIDRESKWNINAVGNKTGHKQTYGYYQMKSKSIQGKPYDYQFEVYWYYVAKRYGITKYDEPNYCNALHHLRTYGWQ
jgi:UDP-N-acetylmuramyl pentapeptide synthase